MLTLLAILEETAETVLAVAKGFWHDLVELSPTSFGSHRLRPMWQSVLCDYFCLLTAGLYRP